VVKKQMLFQKSLRRHAFLSGRAGMRAEMRLLMARIITRGGGQRNFYPGWGQRKSDPAMSYIRSRSGLYLMGRTPWN
jgi:hypothetical protein